jgi:hypothetical protein
MSLTKLVDIMSNAIIRKNENNKFNKLNMIRTELVYLPEKVNRNKHEMVPYFINIWPNLITNQIYTFSVVKFGPE